MSVEQKVSKGRVVLFYRSADDDDPQVAMVSKVHSPTVVNLRILWDGRGDVGDEQSVRQKSSLTEPHSLWPCWDWPPRV